jgi:hypothetical protein
MDTTTTSTPPSSTGGNGKEEIGTAHGRPRQNENVGDNSPIHMDDSMIHGDDNRTPRPQRNVSFSVDSNGPPGMLQYLQTPDGRRALSEMLPSLGFSNFGDPSVFNNSINNINNISTLSKSSSISSTRHIKIPRPTGKYAGVPGTLERWVNEWRIYFRTDNITDETQKIGLAQTSLSGEVRTWYYTYVSANDDNFFASFELMVARFRSLYEPGIDISHWFEKFYLLRCGNSIRQYATDFMCYYEKIKGEINEGAATQFFMVHLPGPLRMEIKLRDPQGLQSTLQMAVKIETFSPHLVFGHSRSSPTNVRPTSSITPAAPRSPQKQTNQQNTPAATPASPKKVRVPTRPCRHCQDPTHMDYDCPTLPKKDKSGKSSNGAKQTSTADQSGSDPTAASNGSPARSAKGKGQ